ncbi:MAG: 2,3-bisphosphoglycerate-independent phosphoglycerate mutase, partial [Alphaproteobacteria bacterium]
MSSQDRKPPRPVVLCILDGWGYREDSTDNAIALARTPTFDRWMSEAPRAWLKTSGLAVGLPDGQMGNSEVGHMNLGSGRVVLQDLPRIDAAVQSGDIFRNREVRDLIEKLQASGGTCHILGLMSPGGVHSHQDHMVALARTVAAAGVPVRIHAFLDGRDTPPRSALEFLAKFERDLEDLDNVAIATVSGRYYAMDRDKRWERVQKAYAAMADAQGERFPTARAVIEASYANDVNDEFVVPAVVGDYAGMADGDGLLMANFRADRAREILTAFVDPEFDGFERKRIIDFAARKGMVEYSSALNPYLDTLFPPLELTDTLGQVMAARGLKQLRIAETEKYAHVTFFFNGGSEEVFEGEDRILVPSPDVATYDLKPEMSAPEVTDRLVDAITSGKYDLIVVNYANPDMVGHTGVLDAAIKAAETIDQCMARLEDAVRQAGGVMLVTADHGNLELMRDPETGQPH